MRNLKWLLIPLLLCVSWLHAEEGGALPQGVFPVVISTYGVVPAAEGQVVAPADSKPGPTIPDGSRITQFRDDGTTEATSQTLTPPSITPGMAITPTPSLAPVGKPVSLDLREMDVVEVLKMLSKQQGINLIIDRNVSGRVTLLLNNVEFWEALKAILNSRDLAYAKEGDLVEIMTSQDYERIYGIPFAKKTESYSLVLSHAKARAAKEMLEPLKSKVGSITVDEVTNTLLIEDTPAALAKMKEKISPFDVPKEMRVFRLNYATVDDLEPKIIPFVSKEYGSIQFDKRSNSLLVEDNPARLDQIAQVIKTFDVRHKSVLIEAKIMQVVLNKSSQSGVSWQGVNWTTVLGQLNGYRLLGTLTQNTIAKAPVTAGAVTAQGITANIGILEKPNFNAVINLLETIGKTNLLSAPRVMALNNQEAKIHVGSKAAKITKTLLNVGSTTSNPITTSNVEFLDTGVKLSVTPSIGDDGTVTMKVKPEVSSVESTITTDDGSSIPIIRVSEAEASLVVKDGFTVVLGGLMENSKVKTDTGVPFLQRIPLLGILFRSHSVTDQKTELVIFLTPHIVKGDEITEEVQNRLDLQPDGTPKKRGFFKRLFGGRA